jgi:hypothetical protein
LDLPDFLIRGGVVFLQGVFEKGVRRTWFFDGRNVVERWLNVVS